MSAIEDRLKEKGLVIPPVKKFDKPNRTGCVQVGSTLYVSGHAREIGDMPGAKKRGKVGSEVSEAEAYITARGVALGILSTIKNHAGDLDKVKRVIRLFGMVNAAPNFERMANVIDGASDFFYEVFGPEFGCHARSAIGVAELPHRAPVEINGEFEMHV